MIEDFLIVNSVHMRRGREGESEEGRREGGEREEKRERGKEEEKSICESTKSD